MNRDADIENRYVDTVGKGEGGTNWESRIDIYTLPCVKQTASEKLSITQDGQPSACDDIEGWEWRGGEMGGRLKRKRICVEIQLLRPDGQSA